MSNKSIPLLGFTSLLILSTIIVNSAAAQQPTKTIGIKITSPAKGQPVSLTSNPLKISGIASHNGQLDCNVYVIVNDMKPYQRALPTGGHNNTNDYSTWVFSLVPSYTTIKTGTNKITSKLACQENIANSSNNSTVLTKFYSVNVTGAPASTTKSLKNSSNIKVGNNSLNTTKTQSSIEKKHPPLSNNTKTSGFIPTNSQLYSKTTKINATKINAISAKGAKNNANVTGQIGRGSQQVKQPSQMTSISAAALLSTVGIISTHQADNHTGGSTNANVNHGQQKGTTSNSSSGPTSTKTNDNSLNNKGSAASGKQGYNTSTITKADNYNARSLSVSMHLAKRPVHVGDNENLTLGVTDSNSTHVVAGASVFGSITDPSGVSKKLEGITNEKGKVSYSWLVSGENTSGKYKVVMKTSAPGYQNNSVSKTFTVLPIPIASSNNSTGASSVLRNINNNNNVTTTKQIASPPSTATPSPKITTTSSSSTSNNNHNSPLISSTQNSTHLALQSSVSNESGRVYIPSTTSTTLSNPTVPPIANSLNSESGRVSIPIPGHNSNIPAISNKVNPNLQTNITKSPVNQGINPIQKPQLPNNNDRIPFVIATPLLHIANGTSMPASNELSSTKALELVDRMRVIGFDSGLSGPPSGVSASSPQKSTVFIPTAK